MSEAPYNSKEPQDPNVSIPQYSGSEPSGPSEGHDLSESSGHKRTFMLGGIVAIAILIFGGALYFLFAGSGGELVRSCSSKYEDLLEANAFDFSTCTESQIRTDTYEAKELDIDVTHAVLIFDASGSMAGEVFGGRKIDIAKEATKDFLNEVDGEENLKLSIVVYGHKGGNTESQKSLSCRGIEEIYPMSIVDATSASAQIDGFSATGWTPIADSLRKAETILQDDPGDNNVVILVSDGRETCDGDPISVVQELNEGRHNIVTSVLGFDVAGPDEEQLRDIAEAGGGDYESVRTAQEFRNALAHLRQTLHRIDYKIGRTIEQLHDVAHVTHTYFQCAAALEREEAAMMLDIHTNDYLGESCKDDAEEWYQERYDSLKNEIESIYKGDKAKFDALSI